ncbi:hypothetical protein D7Z54_32370 [Salibacterium salarium]|uniref:Uncharacterized protein n=1 Tax=Salibacterium salarium TaxID=284579 RepID=A0A3R9P388_9BACI|nr:hypothetical protein [Salibacterium salarium]RSL29234.1 hypothetical protein D7Z54_32370 [Salibacterium salarium]
MLYKTFGILLIVSAIATAIVSAVSENYDGSTPIFLSLVGYLTFRVHELEQLTLAAKSSEDASLEVARRQAEITNVIVRKKSEEEGE